MSVYHVLIRIFVAFSFALMLAWSANAWAQSAELDAAFKQYRLLYKKGNYAGAISFAQTFIALSKEAFGEEHRIYATGLSSLALVYNAQGRYAAAEPLYKRSLVILGKTLGPDHPDVATTLNNLAELYRAEGRYAAAEPLYKRALALYEKALGPDHPLVATSLNNLALLYDAQGRYAVAEPLYKRSLAILEKTLGPDHPNVAQSLSNLAALYHAQGRYAAVEPLHKRSVAILEKMLGPDHPRVAKSLNNLAVLYDAQGRYTAAEPLYKRSLVILGKTLGPDHPDVAANLGNLALLYKAQGRYAAAEPLYKRSLTISEKALGPDHPLVATSLNNLALLYDAQGRYAVAEPLYKRSLTISEKALGPDHPNVAQTLSNLAALYYAQGRHAVAEPLYKRALAIYEKALGPDHPNVAQSLNNLALLYDAQGRYAVAEPLYKRSLTISEKALGPDHPSVATSLNNLALLYYAQGRYAAAEPLFKRSLTISEKALGPDHPSVATSLNNLAWIYDAQGRYEAALGSVRRSTGILRRRGVEGSLSKSVGAESERKSKGFYFRKHVAIAFGAGEQDPLQSVSLHREAFEVVQLAQSSSAASALSQMTARLGAGDTAMASLVRRQQDLVGDWRALDKKLIAELSRQKNKRSPKREARLRADISTASAELTTLDEELVERFPQYAELSNPQPLKVKVAQGLLGNDEAVVLYNGVYAWVVRRDGFRMVKLNFESEELTAAVSKLRSSVSVNTGSLPAFPYNTAHDLYGKIFAPLERDLEGISHVMVVPDGALTSLPLSVLLSSPYRGKGKPAWLAERYAFTTLPSVSSLRAIRVLARKAVPGAEPFTGFGNPVLKGDPSNGRGISTVPIFSKGEKADANELRKLAALPETAEELRIIARSLGANDNHIYLGEKATERRVKSLDLSKTSVIAFATHGLIAGEIWGLAEPGLVLTPPAEATSLDDGVLTASEVAQLKLHPGLVILSACNTASADGTPGAGGLSGLAKAFFYAGSQSLVVSHWLVPSEAAKRLTTSMFANLKRDPSIGRSEALRRSMMALAANNNFSHPIHWAPFILVGEGAVSR